jgi:hypothetical protein
MAIHDLDREARIADRVRRSDEFDAVWNQDVTRGAKVLRAHLVVEHFLNEYLGSVNPHLGSLGEARLSFNQKVALLGEHNPILTMLRPGIIRLNQVRNRLAHRLNVEITPDDVASFMSVPLFSAMYAARRRKPSSRPRPPLKVLEDFAQLSAAMLQMMSEESRNGRPWLKRGAA